MSEDDLPPLPITYTTGRFGIVENTAVPLFVADQMHAYARAAIAAALAVRPPCPHIRSSGGPPGWVTNWCALNGAPAEPSTFRDQIAKARDEFAAWPQHMRNNARIDAATLPKGDPSLRYPHGSLGEEA